MEYVRTPRVAGTFYPAEAQRLRSMIRSFLRSAKPQALNPKAFIVPHAGYVYSGPIAASAYATIAKRKGTIRRVVLIGPAHFVSFRGIASHGARFFKTPLGSVVLDRPILDTLETLDQVHCYDSAHEREHSLEVQLPFLQEVLGEFTLIPLAVGHATPDEIEEVLEKVWGREETLVLVSSDLSHYHDYETARRRDANTSRLIEELKWEEIQSEDACGSYSIKGLLMQAKRRGMKSRTLDLRNSGDTAGPRDQVVGYGSFHFSE